MIGVYRYVDTRLGYKKLVIDKYSNNKTRCFEFESKLIIIVFVVEV